MSNPSMRTDQRARAQAFPVLPDGYVDLAAFRQAWLAMRERHDFSLVLCKFGLSRVQALRLAPSGYADSMAASCAFEVLNLSAQRGVPIALSVGGSRGMRRHVGCVKRLELAGSRLKVWGERFRFHLREDRIAEVGLWRLPTKAGLIHVVEFFDAFGATLARVTSMRQPGRAESCDWRQLLAQLSTAESTCER